MLKQHRPLTQPYLDQCHAELVALLGGAPGRRYFNTPAVLAAEARGFPLTDAILAHVQRTPVPADRVAEAEALFQRILGGLRAGEFENRCHNACAALFLMLDDLGIPSMIVRGHVYGEHKPTGGTFYRTTSPNDFPGQMPGHSWLVTAFAPIVDFTLRHQNFYEYNPAYETYKAHVPCPTPEVQVQQTQPQRAWYFANGRPLTAMAGVVGDVLFRETQEYVPTLGWGLFESDQLTIRYLPQAITLPEENDLGDVALTIGGVNAAEFMAAG